MRRIWDFMRRDARHARSSAIALVVFVGIVVVPSFYAWFNIAGSWDPYGNTRNLRVAVANEDAGYESELLPVRIDLGERVVANLRASDSIGYVVTSADEAREGVRSGAYYAALVIPEDFSRDLMSTLTAHPERPQVTFYQNEKKNAIAAIVTDKARSAVMADIDASFAEAVTSVGAGVADELSSALGDDQVAGIAGRLDAAVVDASGALSDAAGELRSFSALLASTEGLLGSGADTAAAALDPVADADGALDGAADGLEEAGAAIDGAVGSVTGALEEAAGGLDGVDEAIDQAFETAGAQGERLDAALGSAGDAVTKQIGLLERLSAALDEQDGLTREFQRHYEAGGVEYERIDSARVAVEGLKERVDQALSELRELSDRIAGTRDDLASGAADARAAHEELSGLVRDARTALQDAGAAYDEDLRDALSELAGTVRDAVGKAGDVQASLAGTLSAVEGAERDAASSLKGAQGGLDETAAKLDEAAGRLSDLHERLAEALGSGDVARVRAVLSAGPGELARFIAAPVAVERTAVFPVENNGSAMTPFYTTLAIWIGGVVLAALVRATPSAAALAETGCTHAQAYLARGALFCATGLAQAALICGGDLFYLGVQCEHPGLFLLACCASSVVYVNLIYALTASFGDVGKAVAVVLMVVQVAGSGGTFPPQMLPAAFQEIYRWLPFVHSEGALRAAMFGVFEGDFWRELATLLAYLVPALLLGLVARRPVIRLNEWFERRLEETRVM